MAFEDGPCKDKDKPKHLWRNLSIAFTSDTIRSKSALIFELMYCYKQDKHNRTFLSVIRILRKSIPTALNLDFIYYSIFLILPSSSASIFSNSVFIFLAVDIADIYHRKCTSSSFRNTLSRLKSCNLKSFNSSILSDL